MEDKIREAIEVVKACTPVKIENQSITVDMLRDSFNCLVELAELYLSVSKDMPKKKECKYCGSTSSAKKLSDKGCVSCCPEGIHHEHVYNDAIDECTFIAAKLLAEKDAEIKHLNDTIESLFYSMSPPASMSTSIGLVTIDSNGMRKLVGENERLREEITQLKKDNDYLKDQEDACKKLDSVKDRLLSKDEIKEIITNFYPAFEGEDGQIVKQNTIKAIYKAQQDKMDTYFVTSRKWSERINNEVKNSRC